MSAEDQKIIDTSLDQVRTLNQNIGNMWDGDTRASFYYNVLSGTIARNGPEIAQAITAMLTEVYTNTAKARVDLGRLTTGFAPEQSTGTQAPE
jgi:hypothetical protein